MVPMRTLRRGQHLYRPGDMPAYVYSVHRGALKTDRFSHDCSECISGFHFPGEMLELDALLARPVRRGAVALETGVVSMVPVAALRDSLGHSEVTRSQLLDHLGDEITRLEEHLLLDALSAEQRLAAFVLWVVGKFPDRSNQPTVRLPMSHKEIGSYLRLTPETMSRLLARFQERAWLSIRQRDLTVRDLELLRRTAAGEKSRPIDGPVQQTRGRRSSIPA